MVKIPSVISIQIIKRSTERSISLRTKSRIQTNTDANSVSWSERGAPPGALTRMSILDFREFLLYEITANNIWPT